MLSLKNLFGKKEDPNAASVQAAPGAHAPGIAGAVAKLFDKNEKEVARLQPTVAKIAGYGPELKAMSDEELKAKSAELKQHFRDRVTEILSKSKDPATGEPYTFQELDTEFEWSDDYNTLRRDAEKLVLDELLPEAFALVREAGDRTIGLRHFDVQMIGGSVLHSGRIAEMRTGEGKTLVATLPTYLNTLSGRGVHVITVNDYLAERDANWMRPIYEFLGLSVAFLTNDMTTEQRIPAYHSDVLYATNSEVGFDYLRDNMSRASHELVQRSLNFAIVDEVDNILIDEARTPLIISAQVAKTDRALRRQEMAKTCDGLARKLMPAVTDREVELLQDSLTGNGRINIDGLMEGILKTGAFTSATAYLIESYLIADRSARTESAARLLDVAAEFSDNGLINAEGRAGLEAVAINAVRPAGLRTAWDKELIRQTLPFAEAFAGGVASGGNGAVVVEALSLNEDAAVTITERLDEAEDKPLAVANAVASEIARRGFVEESATEMVAANLIAQISPTADLPALTEAAHDALLEVLLQAPGNLLEADTMLNNALPGDLDDQRLLNVEETHRIVDALDQISLRGLLPFETTEKLWEAVHLTQGRDGLRKEIASAIQKHPGATAQKISALAGDYKTERTSWLKENANAMRSALAGHEMVATKAQSGESAIELRRILQNELSKTGDFAEAMKAVKKFTSEQQKAHEQSATQLVAEMEQWVEVPREARRALTALLNEGGTIEEIRERILLAVRDLPGENTELPALISESTKQLEQWRSENAVELVAAIRSHVPLPDESGAAIVTAIEDGDISGFDHFAGSQLLESPQIAELTSAIDTFGAQWDAFKERQNAALLEGITGTLGLSGDAQEALADTLNEDAAALDAAIFSELASDVVSRHLEPLLAEENAPAFAEEVTRRIPLAKEVQRKVRPTDFTGRSAEQLQRALVRLVERSFAVMPVEDFKRVVKNLGWLTEKDEKRRQAALTDMGTLIAEREAGTSAFTDPDGFLDTLVGSEILTDDEAAIVRRAQVETPDDSLSTVIDRVLRLPAERRRRLSESKLQEVQSILDQSIKAHALFNREVNYVIDQGREIVIVDEFTGRKMPGRRYSEGLHEALEAKHGLEVQLESQTVATITIQNYFRLYNKIAGMTGTAKTEEAEFAKTYGIEVVSIPTNRTIQRRDYPDVVYKTTEAKMRAITFEILEHHCAGQPVLVGTRSVEVSEKMSERLKAQPLQVLVLSQLIKNKLWEDKQIPDEQKRQIIQNLQTPVAQINPLAVKNIARQIGLQPDVAHDENVNAFLSLFTVANPSRERLVTALRNGLPHNVLNAKNHRNEARIVAEAARPASVTIATNMAGRGVDIVLGGTLDVESRWRVMTLQAFARTLEGKAVHVRSRNEETTQKYVDRLTPERLQNLAWTLAVSARLAELEASKHIEGALAKELRDTLAQDVTTSDLKNRVRSRARRLGIVEQLPLDADPLQDEVVLNALNNELKRLMGRGYDLERLRAALESGIAAQASGRDPAETALLQALSRPLEFSSAATGALLKALAEVSDLDRELLEAAAAAEAVRASDFDNENLAEKIGDVTAEWVGSRLKELNIHDSPAARHRLQSLGGNEIETNELRLLAAIGDAGMGVQWLRERLNELQVLKNLHPYTATEEMQPTIGDTTLVHGRLDRALAQRLQHQWKTDAAHRRTMTTVEAPNLVLLGDLAEIVGQNSPIIHPEWLHHMMFALGILDEEDVVQAQMMGQAEDEEGNVHDVPLDVLVYRIRLNRVLDALVPTLRQVAAQTGADATAAHGELLRAAPWAEVFIDEAWVSAKLGEIGSVDMPENAAVFIETGVSGQSADIVLESEPRPEDIAHTSEQEEVKTFGGLHIIGSERHESRRIDNQLRGRAGRQGDPGSSRFYVSLEDELWRLFGVRGQWMLSKWDEDEAVESPLISKSVERAQKKVELNHFEGRKHVLQFDDVMNVQREVIYRERRRALLGSDLKETVVDMAQQAALAEADKHCPREVRPEEWDAHKLDLHLGRIFGATNLHRHLKPEEIEEMHNRDAMDERLREVVAALYDEREAQLGAEQLRGLERWQVTRSIDEHWMEHLAEMDYLRDAIWQEGYAQKEPIGVYRQEGFSLFQKMLGEIRREVAEAICAFQAEPQGVQSYSGPLMSGLQEARLVPQLPMDADGFDDGVMLDKDDDDEDGPLVISSPAQAARAGVSRGAMTALAPAPAVTANGGTNGKAASGNGKKPGRNEPCHCGSGKKYKKCCLPNE